MDLNSLVSGVLLILRDVPGSWSIVDQKTLRHHPPHLFDVRYFAERSVHCDGYHGLVKRLRRVKADALWGRSMS